jgi:hypothetical protein
MSKTTSNLLGYARKSKAGGALKLSIDFNAFITAKRFKGKDGREFVALVVNADNLNKVMAGEKPVTSVSQIVDPVEAAE